MSFNFFDGFFEFDCDWKAIVGIGMIVLGYVIIKMF